MQPIEHLYLHVPFCTWVCAYCDFTAYPVLQGMISPYLDALEGEIRAASGAYPVKPLRTVFIGGGTPSLLEPLQVARLLATVAARCGIRADAEVTLEANPGTVNAVRAAGWLQAGVNRLSIGVQSLNPSALRFLERLHTGEEALAAVRAARAAGFRNLNCDLLYGVPGVTLQDWLHSLDRVLAEGPDHLSAYELTVEAGTRLAHEVRRGRVTMPDADAQLAQYWAAAERLRAAGFEHYEISNWARPGAACRHNLAGWEYRPYLGCGAGAHSLVRHADGSSERWWNVKGLRAYMQRAPGGQAVDGREVLSAERAAGEAAMLGIRVLSGTRAAKSFPAERRRLVAAKLLLREGDVSRLTPRGVELANQVGALFLR